MKFGILFFLVVFFSKNVYSQCKNGNCKNGSGEMAYADGSRFMGEFENGKKKKGIYFYPNKDSYEGEFNEGSREGFGIYIYSNGDKYEGFYKDDLKSYGQFNFRNEDFYKGNFFENQFHGYGSFQKKNGELIEGFWEKGKISWGIDQTEPVADNDTLKLFTGIFSVKQTFERDASKKPRVFALIVGISDYQGTENDLRYADRDAIMFHNHLKSAMSEEISDGKLLLLLNEKATSSAIKTAIESIYKDSSADDFIIFYFSGHGGVGRFIPYDHASNSINHAMIKEVFRNTDARFRLVVADACFSGSIGSENQSSVTSTQDLYDARLAVIMSSKPNQTSLELPGLKQGVFSYFLIKGMQGLADMNRDKYVTAGELFLYTRSKVSNYTTNSQVPVIYGVNLDKIPLAKIR